MTHQTLAPVSGQIAFDLPGIEHGRRVETIEWGNRIDKADWSDGPGIEPADSEYMARLRAEQTMYGHRGPYHSTVVSRTVVTYTSHWGVS